MIQAQPLPRLLKREDLLEWARRLVDDLFLRWVALAEVVNNLSGGGGTPAAHNLLSTTHTDTSPASPPPDGAIVIGAGGSWVYLPVGASGTFLHSVGTDAGWAVIQRTDLPSPVAFEDEQNLFTVPQAFLDYFDIANNTPGTNPASGRMRLYVNQTGSTIQLRVRAPDGTECVLCSKVLGAGAATLPLNWVQ